MKKGSQRSTILVLLALALAIGLSGCSSSGLSILLVASGTAIDQGATTPITITATVHHDTNPPQGVTFTCTVTSGTNAAGCDNFASSGNTATYLPPAAVPTQFQVTITATSVAKSTVSKSVVITVSPAMTLAPSQPPATSVGSAFSFTVVTGGTPPFTLNVTSGTLPSWLSFDKNTGVLSGTVPNGATTSTFTVTVTDATGVTTAPLVLTITIKVQIGVSTASLPTGEVGIAFDSGALAASEPGNPGAIFTWSATGLPAWASINTSTGAITGASPTQGSTQVTVTATDAANASTTIPGSKTLTLTINAALALTTTSLPDGTVGTAYSQSLALTGGVPPITFAITSGALPTGLTLNTSTGVISGTPTAGGTFSFTATATDALAATSSQPLSITVNTVPLAITTTSLPAATVGQAFSTTLQTSGGTGAAVTWSVTTGALPAWASLNASTGVISGTPGSSDVGSTVFTVTATDGTTSPTQQLTLTVKAAGTNNAELNGRYAFRAAGYNEADGAFYTVTGSFDTDGSGAIIGGEEDVLSFDSANTGVTIAPFGTGTGSSYSVGDDNRGTLTIVTSLGTQTFAIAVGGITSGVATHGRVIGTDAGLVISGEMLQQVATPSQANFNGSYAFLNNGAESSGLREAVAGEVTLTASAGTGGSGSGEIDFVDESGTVSGVTAVSEIFTAPDFNGRSAVNLTIGSTTVHFAQYAVTANEGFLIGTDPASVNPLFIGIALKRTTGTFNNGTLHGTSVLYTEGVEQLNNCGGPLDCGTRASVGLLTMDGSGGFTLTMDQNHGGSISSGSQGSANYSVDSNGRVVLTNSGNHPPILYLVGSNEGFILGTDARVETGFFQPQTATTTSGTFTFGTNPPRDPEVKAESGIIALNAGVLTGTTDENDPAPPTSNVTFGNAITDAAYTIDGTGRIVVTDTGASKTEKVGYVVSSSTAILIDIGADTATPTVGKTNPSVDVLEK